MFRAKIYKVGINPVVKVPPAITNDMKPVKGYIPVSGTINGFTFKQTLCPVKGQPYRLYVNFIMLKGGNVKLGDTAAFTLQQNFKVKRKVSSPMHAGLKRELEANDLMSAFDALSVPRKRDILNYLNKVKAIETLKRNIAATIYQLRQGVTNVRIPHPDFTRGRLE